MKRVLALIAMLTMSLGSAAVAQQNPYPPSTPTSPPTTRPPVTTGPPITPPGPPTSRPRPPDSPPGPPTSRPRPPVSPPVTPGRPDLRGERASFAPGAAGTFTLSDCAPGEAVSFQLYSAAGAPIGSPVPAVAGADGSATVRIALPTTPGSYYVVGTCVASGVSARFDVTVAALPTTGSDSETALQIGAILLGTGAVLFAVAGARRRQRHAPSAT